MVPARERGTASAIFNSAQYFATVLFAPIMGWLAYTFGWPYVFYFMGGLGLLFCVAWLRWMHDPGSHPRLSRAEYDYISAGGALTDLDQRAPVASSVDASAPVLRIALRTLLAAA